MQTIRKGITLLASFLDVIEEFPTYEMRADFIYKVYLYGTTGEEPIFDDALQRIAWKAIRPVVEHSAAKYEEKREADNAKRGNTPSIKILNSQDEDMLIDKFLYYNRPVHATLRNEFISRFIAAGEPFPVEEAREIILNMPYDEFLKTPYWKSISKYVKTVSGNRCQKCGSARRLQVHHMNYQHHGDELHHLEDLICLCKDCHLEIHNEKRIH